MRCRIIHYIGNPFSGMRVPIAALLETDDGVVTALGTDNLPGAAYLGAKGHACAQMLRESIERDSRSFWRLPTSAGPSAVMGDPITLPRGVADPQAWVRIILDGRD